MITITQSTPKFFLALHKLIFSQGPTLYSNTSSLQLQLYLLFLLILLIIYNKKVHQNQLYCIQRDVELNFLYPLITLSTAFKKSFSVATFLLALIANIPASVQTDLNSAPVEFGHSLEISSHLIPVSYTHLDVYKRQ